MVGGTRDYDVAVLGAGLVGLSLAASLARAGMRTAIADRSAVEAAAGCSSADDWDARVYAISPGSVAFLTGIGAWQRLRKERLCAIESMDVRGDAGGRLVFSAYELGERALAWIVENRELHAALVACVRETPGIDVLAPRAPAGIAWSAAAAELRFDDGDALSSRLIVGADGVRSWARAQAGMHQDPQPYAQTAVVANFASERAHHGRAFQWFLPAEGVLAWLPLPGHRISMVWSAPASLAGELTALDGGALAERVALSGGASARRPDHDYAPSSFPLSLLRLPSVIAQRLALVGDAAHGVHPLAGQGVNLGFGDAAVLSAILSARGAVHDPGASLLLERYASRRLEPVLAMQGVTDGLVRLLAPAHRGSAYCAIAA